MRGSQSNREINGKGVNKDKIKLIMVIDIFNTTNKYKTIYADPPWQEVGGGKIKRGADRHYPLMKTKDILQLPVPSLCDDNCHLYLWTTNNFLPDAFEVMKTWGFEYKTCITWVKGFFPIDTYRKVYINKDHLNVADYIQLYKYGYSIQEIAKLEGISSSSIKEFLRDNNVPFRTSKQYIPSLSTESDGESFIISELNNAGLGQYFRGITEHCLFGVKGNLPYKVLDGKRQQGTTLIVAPRQEHSRKPDEMRAMIEKVSYPSYIELFARREYKNWDSWGNEII